MVIRSVPFGARGAYCETSGAIRFAIAPYAWFDHKGGGAFALGAGDVNDAKPRLRVAEPRK